MDMNQLMQALRNADAAGDTQAASRIAQMIQNQRQQQTAAPAQDRNVAENLGTGMMDRVYAIGEGLTNLLPTVTKAVTGMENARIVVPENPDGFYGIDWANLGDTTIAEDKNSTGENLIAGFDGGATFEKAADYLAKNREALNYQPLTPWNEVKANPSAANVLAFMGEAAVTSLPDMAAVMLSTPAYFASYLSPIAEKRAENDGRTQVTPEDLAYAAVTAMGIAGAERFGAKGVFGQNAGNVAQRIVGAGVKESGTEAIQNPLQYAGETVGTKTGFDAAEAGDQALAGAVGGFGAGTGLRTGTEVITAGGQTAPEDVEAAGNLARRLDATAKNNGFKTDNVSQAMDVKGARALVDQAHVNISDEISTEQKALKKELTHDTKNDTEETKRLKNLAKSALRNARNKTKGIVTTEEYTAVEQLVGGTAEGQRMLALMRESNELTTLHNQGLKGGISRFTDKINPLSFGEGYATKKIIEGAGKTALYGGAFAGAGPAGPIALGAAAIGGRAIDAVTGKRSNVANFIRQNRDNTGVREAASPSVRTAIDEQNQARQERSVLQETLNRQDFDANRPITNEKSPAGMINKDTGLDRQQQVAVAERMLQMPEHQDIKEQLEQLIRSVKGFNQKVNNISNVSARILEEIRKQGGTTPNQQNTNNNSQQIPGGVPQVSPLDMARRQQGILDNRQRIDTLRQQAAADETLSQDDKNLVEDALLDLKRDLGRNPVQAAERIINGAADLAENRGRVLGHLIPYLERVQQQQSRNTETNADQPMESLFNNDPMRISPRRPTAVGATENPLEQSLQIGTDAILNSSLGEKLMPKVMNYLGIKGGRSKGDNRTDEQVFIDHIKDNLLHLYNSVSPEYRARAKQWYVGANRLSQQAADKYGLALHQVAGVMASLSPQKDWYMNYDLGIRTIDAYTKIKPTDLFTKEMATAFRRMIKKQNPAPRKVLNSTLKIINGAQFQDLSTYEKAVFIRFYDEINNPERGHRVITPEGELIDFQRTVKGEKSGTAWNGFGDIQKAVEIIENGARENIDVQLGMMHKVRSFYNNILSPMSDQGDVTIDTHAVAAGHLRPFSGNHQEVAENFKAGGKSGITGAVGAYGLYADAYRAAAAEAGVLPREMQSITWEAVRGLFTPAYKGQKKNQETIANIWKRYDANDITIDQVRQEVFDAAGGINRAAWEGQRPNSATAEQAGIVANAGNLSGSGVSRTGDGQRAGGEPSRPLLRPPEGVNEDRDLERVISQVDFTEPRVQQTRAADLISRLTKMTEPEYGYIQRVYKTLPKAVKRLDPQGREIASLVQIGLAGGKPQITNEQIEKIFPHLVDAFDTLLAGRSESRGQYSMTTSKKHRRISIRKPDELYGGEASWLEIFLHELGHSIESQSGVRSAVSKLKHALNPAFKESFTDQEKAEAEDILDQMEEISRDRRPQSWRVVGRNLKDWETALGSFTSIIPVPSMKQIAYMSKQDFQEIIQTHVSALQAAGADPSQLEYALPQLKDQIDYLYKPSELSADALAHYMISPSHMKAFNPEVAALMRQLVNNSDVGKFITFHSIAGLLGAGVMTSLLAGMGDDEETKGILSLGSGSLSSAA